MRPFPGDDAFAGRSRSTSFIDNDTTPLASRAQPPQMSYFIADERSIDVGQIPSPTTPAKQNHNSPKASNYGVESLETSTSSLPDNEDPEERLRNARHNWKKTLTCSSRFSEDDLAGSASTSAKSEMSRNVSPSHQRRPSQTTMSRPSTPLSFDSPAPASLTSSPDSRRNSDAGSFLDDITSQAIASSGDEEAGSSRMMDSGSAPQLVMPSIKMPSRRPFTEKGRNMGRLKVLVAGDSGVGKSSLIKAIVQTCEDIVHVDPLSSTPIAISDIRRNSKRSRYGSDMQPTSQITEIYASTRAYPSWWSDLEESRVLRRRKSMGDSILERNLCFVDTPGYGNKTSCLECISPVVGHIESHLQGAFSFDGLSESNIINMLSGSGGSQIDLVLYLILHRVKPVDVEYLSRLSHLTNVIPVIAHSDTFSSDQLDSMKIKIQSDLQGANIRHFQFTPAPNEPAAPYAISSITSKDEDTMDASLLMSPDYVSPLVDSELKHLVSQIFSPDNVTWLRHSAAKKFIAWRASNTPVSKPMDLYRPLSTPSSSRVLTAPVGATTSYALARISDHTQREERIAQVRLANWAADLQRSLANERVRFESLARSERAVWLTERLGECVQDGTIIPISQARQKQQEFSSGTLVKHGSRRWEATIGMNRNDPLRLLQLNSELRQKGWVVLKIISSFGIIGGLAFWIAKNWHGEGSDMAFWDLNFGRFMGD